MGVAPHRPKIAKVVSDLLEWYAKNARDLPWRRTSDPYAILVSEIMLQQTQVRTVIPYYERWLRTWPDAASLAAASPERVLKLWEGLGYYRRARHLQEAARRIVTDHGGAFPRGFEEVLALPGVGRYTAGAVCSMAFNQPAPILDGNVVRVLCRLFGLRGDPKERSMQEELWRLARSLVQTASRIERPTKQPGNRVPPSEGPGSAPPIRNVQRRGTPQERGAEGGGSSLSRAAGFCSALNQSLMELGALACTPRKPACGECPLGRYCVARRQRLEEKLPEVRKRPKSSRRRQIALVMERDGRLYVRQRPGHGVNADFWEFPTAEAGALSGASGVRELLGSFGLEGAPARPVGIVKHSIMNQRFEIEAWHVRIGRGQGRFEDKARWLGRREMETLPLTTAHRKILRQMRATLREPRPAGSA